MNKTSLVHEFWIKSYLKPIVGNKYQFLVAYLICISYICLAFLPDSGVYNYINIVISFLIFFILPGVLLLNHIGFRRNFTDSIVTSAILSVVLTTVFIMGLSEILLLFSTFVFDSELLPFFQVSVILISLLILSRTQQSLLPHPKGVKKRPIIISIIVISMGPLIAYSNSPVISSILLAVVGVVPFLENHYRSSSQTPLLIFSSALGILLSMTMVSDGLWGWDIHYIYWNSSEMLKGGYWIASLETATAQTVTTTLLPASFVSVSGMELYLVYKLIYPILFSMLPVVVFMITKEIQPSEEWTHVPSYVVIFFYGFFKNMPSKQAISILFFLFGIYLVYKYEKGKEKNSLIVMFVIIGGILSHYLTSLIFMGIYWSAGIMTFIISKIFNKPHLIERKSIGVYLLIPVSWFLHYGFVAGGYQVSRFIHRGIIISRSLFSPETSERTGVGYLSYLNISPQWAIYIGLTALVIGLCLAGTILAGYRIVATNSVEDPFIVYAGFSCLFIIPIFMITPAGVGIDRIISITLPIVALFSTYLIYVLGNNSAILQNISINKKVLHVICMILMLSMFLFSSGIAFYATGEEVPEYSININKDAGWPVYAQSEITATRWADTMIDEISVLSHRTPVSSRDALLISEVKQRYSVSQAPPNQLSDTPTKYIYISNKPLDSQDYYDHKKELAFHPSFNEIYSSGESSIYQR